MKLPDAVLAFKLLHKSNLSVKERQLALTACNVIKFDSMKSALKRIFSESTCTTSDSIQFKQEPSDSERVYYTDYDTYNVSNNRFSSSSSTNRPKFNSYGRKSGFIPNTRNSTPDNYRPRNYQPDASGIANGGGYGSNGNVRGTNPMNKFGKRSKCVICESIFHWAKDCPHKVQTQGVNLAEQNDYDARPRMTYRGKHSTDNFESVNFTLFNKTSEEKNAIFVVESYGAAVLDTACTKTVCGRNWLQQYISCLDEAEIRDIRHRVSNQQFKFGDGATFRSYENSVIPAVIGGTSCKISTEVVDCDIPLLLSKESLKKAGTILNLQNDTAKMFGKSVNLEFTSSGHYCVNLVKQKCNSEITNSNQDQDQTLNDEVLAIQNLDTGPESNGVWSKAKLIKLHRQFGHASVEKIEKLLQNAGIKRGCVHDSLTEVVKSCDVCTKFKRPPAKPAVCLPLAYSFNEVIAMDLHELGPSLWYLHIIDVFTRYSAATVIKSKQSGVIAKKLLLNWISIHGSPKTILTDNGREFDNNELRDLGENFNIIIKTTPAYSPWSNGILERHNKTLTEILDKVKDGNNIDLETALAWAVNSKNSLCNVHGYSSHQLVYGGNPNLPTTLTDKPPALEGTTMSKIVADHLTALHVTRKAFIEAESSERIRRALRKQTRSFDNFVTGDKVYYKRVDNKEWKGPGVVIGQDGVVIFVRHGGSYVRVHKCRLSKVLDSNSIDDTQNLNDGNEDITNGGYDENSNTNIEANHDINVAPGNVSDDEGEIEPVEITEGEGPTELNNIIDFDKTLIKTGQVLKFTDHDHGTSNIIKILSRAGKATGNLKYWFNVEYLKPDNVRGQKISMNLKEIDDLKFSEASTDTDIENVLIIEDVSFDNPKLDELNKWKEFHVYNEVPDIGQRCISTRWVCTIKETSKGNIHKARLVARGFEDLERNSVQKDSPTCAKESLRMLLAITAQRSWEIKSMDIKTAFLQGSNLTRNVFIKPPKEANAGKVVWHLNKCVYGLNDASLHWYTKVKEVMTRCGATVSVVDPAVYYWHDTDTHCLKGVLASHVDDFIWAGNEGFEGSVVNQIRKLLNVGNEESVSFKYVGLNLKSSSSYITLDQKQYINSINSIDISKGRLFDKSSKLEPDEADTMRSKVGQIMWMANQTRPDVMFNASSLASSIKRGTVADLVETNKVIRKLRSEVVTLKFHRLGDDESLKLVIYSDASLGNLPDGGSQGGHFIFLTGSNGCFSPLAWQSKKIRRVVRSTLAAETLALADAIDVGVYLALLYKEIMQVKALPIECITDNHSLYDHLNTSNHVQEKRLRIEISAIKELISSHQIRAVHWSPTKTQLADCLTKHGASPLAMLRMLEAGVWEF